MTSLDFFHLGNAQYLQQLREQYQADPKSVPAEWRGFFAGFDAGREDQISAASTDESRNFEFRRHVHDLVHSYRELGHCIAKIDPLEQRSLLQPLLDLREMGLSEADLDKPAGESGFLGPAANSVGELLDQLRATYCGPIGVEYMDITDKAQRLWLQEQMEPLLNRPALENEERLSILESLIAAETFEQFLNDKFLGQKRFSVEGAESLLPLLLTAIEEAAELGVEQLVIGMPHRGRLNVLAHVIGKPYELILGEFMGNVPMTEGEGDVKYHLGYSSDRSTKSGTSIHLSLSANPSHLELVNPVIEGMVRAKQDRLHDDTRGRVVPLLIHGDASFTGQGSVPETLSLSQLPGYRTGGTIHVIVNNQIGFTATPEETRFTPYPTDAAKMIQSPVLHVNGDDPEAVVNAAKLAVRFRQQFKADVFIDLWCYRKHGHNEIDDPSYTQPTMYRKIAQHPSVAVQYGHQLANAGVLKPGHAEQIQSEVKSKLNEALAVAKDRRPRQRVTSLGGWWSGLNRIPKDWSAATAVRAEELLAIAEANQRLPAGFRLHPKLQKLMERRQAMADGKTPIDWGCAEAWAIGTLLLEGNAVRLTGQDTERGTFSHRHAVLHDVESGLRYVPLQHLAEKQGRFTILNTILSELSVLGFEYGFSSADPDTLVIWEAQFGDFANGAQPIIDQFLVSGESKWQRMSGLVMLLPHGYEGQGPEHSSARLERFLQLCAEDNLQVCYPSEPAQYFHMLRRQIRRPFRKPLVVMSPKSLLRDPRSTSRIEQFTEETVRLAIDDPRELKGNNVERVLLCTGHVYFLLEEACRKRNLENVAVVRLEQLYPFPREELISVLSRYSQAKEWFWVQEEPRNMGAWTFLAPLLRDLPVGGQKWQFVGRKPSASPASGQHRLHEAQERSVLEKALPGNVAEPASEPSTLRDQPDKQLAS